MNKKEPASELMKRVAVKAPSKKKIEKDFSPEEAKEIYARINQAKLACYQQCSTVQVDSSDSQQSHRGH